MKNLDLGTEKINKLLLTFTIPCIVSMLINSIYNIVDQIFIGQGVGTIGNAATNVIFPLIIICNSIASLVGNGTAANLSLRLGEGNVSSAKKSTGCAIVTLFIVSIITTILGEIFLSKLVNWFGCTPNVYDAAITYGRIILLGVPFMIVYSGLSSIIRADGSPKYSMVCLLVGAIINIILDPIFIFGFKLGISGGAWATIIGQFVSFIIALLYLKRFKTIKLELSDYRINNSLPKTLTLGLSSFITQMTVLALFVVMNNLMTKYGATSIYGADIPLSVYGIISKLNGFYVSSVLGVSIGTQPIIGFNYGAKKLDRVKEILKKVVIINFIIGLLFNIIFFFFPKQVIPIFISSSDPNYELFMQFAIDCSKIFLLVSVLNAFEMTSSIVIQSLGNVKKATIVSFTRQIFLFIPLALILCHIYGLYGALYAGPIADSLCFIVVIFVFGSEYLKLDNKKKNNTKTVENNIAGRPLTNLVITIAREYGSGGRYVGKLLSKELNIPVYDKEMIPILAKQSGFDKDYIAEIEETKNAYYENNNKLFAITSKVIKNLSQKPCIIIGCCGNYILRDNPHTFNIFLYSDDLHKEQRIVNYYHVPKDKAKKTLEKKNKERSKYYEYYTEQKWQDLNNYDLAINVDAFGIENTVQIIIDTLKTKN